MNEELVVSFKNFVLPPSIVSRVDITRLLRDGERVDNEYTEGAARQKAGSDVSVTPNLSDNLTRFLEINKLDFSNSRSRSQIIGEIRKLKDQVPVFHMTFSSEADRESLEELSRWLRAEIHPQVVIEDGLQPAIIAGLYLRTPNHVHDLSLKSTLKKSRGILVKELEAARGI